MPTGSNRFPLSCFLTTAVVAGVILLTGCSHTPPEVPSSAIQAFHRGVEAYQEEDYPRAARLFELAAAKDDRNAIVYYNLGLAYYMLEAYPEAIEAYHKALKLDPKFADAHMNLALAFDRVYDLDQANAHYNEYLTLVRGAKPRAADANGATPMKTSASATQGPKSGKFALGGEPLSNLPGGTLAKPKGEPPPLSARSRSRQAVSNPGSTGGRVPVGELRRVPQETGKAPSARSNESTSSNPAQWWTRDTLPKTR